jgi:uncharacterized protein
MRVLAISMIASLAIGMSANRAWADTDARWVQVNGSGEVHAEPDRAVVMLGVESRKPMLDEARVDVTRGIEALLKLTRELKIDPKDVRTTRLVVQPEYDWNGSHERRLLGYYVARQSEIVVRDLEQLGFLLERAVSLGANSVSDPRLESSRQHELEREALALAIDDARLNAESAARAANMKLGLVRTMDSSVAHAPITFASTQMAMARTSSISDSRAGKTYQAGELTFTASVRVQYDLAVK